MSAAAEEATSPWRTLVSKDANYDLQPQTGRLRVTPGHYGYLKISEGCSNACTFCAIPNFRGLFRSKPRDMVLAEARELTESGAGELNIISQDTTHYGIDLEGETWQTGLANLLRELGELGNLRWIRLLYAYPGHVSDELMAEIEAMSQMEPASAPTEAAAPSAASQVERRVPVAARLPVAPASTEWKQAGRGASGVLHGDWCFAGLVGTSAGFWSVCESSIL